MSGFTKDFGSILLWPAKRETYSTSGENFYGFSALIDYICVLLEIRSFQKE